MSKQTVAFCTLGCKVNQYDTQAMREAMERAGYEAAPFSGLADIYVINTCTVTGVGDKKSRQMIRRAAKRNPEAAIVVTGCMAQRAAESLLLPGVRLVLGTQRRGEIVSLLTRALSGDEPLVAVESLTGAGFERLSVRGSEGRTRATLKIQEGCDGHCTYCVIPSVRGEPRSRPLADIRAEAERLVSEGFREIVVTGIHLSSYGRDFADGTGLLDALRAISGVPGIARIRIGSLEPRIVTAEFAEALRAIDTLCPHFMLALQSGSDAVLSRMARRYTSAGYREAAGLLRSAFPGAALTTDLMTGFPGETDEEFAETLSFVREMGFARIHVFPYSEREGTIAQAMPGSVPKAVREARAAELIQLGERLSAAYIDGWIGRTAEVLFEEEMGEGASGYTREYIRVTARGVRAGGIREVLLTDRDGEEAVGVI